MKTIKIVATIVYCETHKPGLSPTTDDVRGTIDAKPEDPSGNRSHPPRWGDTKRNYERTEDAVQDAIRELIETGEIVSTPECEYHLDR